MNIRVNNHAGLPNKHVRLIRWKIYKLFRKFNQLLYAEVFVKKEGRSYLTTVKLGVKGRDIILKHKHEDVYQLWKTSFDDGLRYLRKYKEKRLAFS